MFNFGALEVSLLKLIDDFIMFAEVESALIQFGVAVFQNAAKLGDRLVEEAILFINQPIEPSYGPVGRRWIAFSRAFQRLDSVIQAAFLEIDTSEIHRAVSTSHFLHFIDRLNGLTYLPLLPAHLASPN